MLEDSLTLYKLIVLHMLSRVKFPLTTAQISNFMLEQDYTDYLTLQQIFSELSDAGMIRRSTVHNRTLLHLTEEGRSTLQYFSSRISDGTKADIDLFLRENELTLRNEVSVQADYYKATSGEYEARLLAKEKEINLIELTLSVPTKEIAAAVCDHWQSRNQEIYKYIVQQLF